MTGFLQFLEDLICYFQTACDIGLGVCAQEYDFRKQDYVRLPDILL